MAHHPFDSVILIPSLEPDRRLPEYIDRLKQSGFTTIVVIDDGSVGDEYQAIFSEIDSREGCKVLHHEVNCGKGVALKTGYRWIMANCPDTPGVITADADGQHTVEDCIKLAEKLSEGKRALYLGSRDFNLPGIPERSVKGNKITSNVFKVLYGQYLPDTQTGLRAFLKQDLQFMAEVEGDRYEYEMNVLIACARAGIEMIPITIETIYENNNEGSHFHPIRDSWRIYRVILGSFFRYTGVSILSWMIDQGLANLFFHWLMPMLGVAGVALEYFAGYCARLISGVFNFMMNRRFVFKSNKALGRSAIRYLILAIGIITVSNILVDLLDVIMPYSLVKILVDLLLYFVSYRVQDCWVFSDKKENKG